MANPNGRKGAEFERDVCDVFQAELGEDYEIERRKTNGAKDRGDVSGIRGWVFECKNREPLNPSGALTELEVEISNAEAQHGFAILKRRGKHAREAYCLTPLWRLVKLVAYVKDLENEVKLLRKITSIAHE